jgi:hypothetical protein
MAKKVELFNIGMSQDGSRMVAKLEAEKLVATAYDGSEIVLTKGDYMDIASFSDVMDNLNFLLEKEYLKQEHYDKKVSYMEMIKDGFRAKVSMRKKKD